MKRIYIFLASVIIINTAFSQARISTAEYQKIAQPAVVTEIPFPEKTVSNAINDKMERIGYKGKDNKGYKVYKGVRIAEVGPDSYDFYFSTERKSKKEKDITSVTLLISSGFEKFISKDSSNGAVLTNAITFLNKLQGIVTAYDLEQQISEQEAISGKADKKLAGSIEEGQDLQRKKQKIEDDITANIKAQADLKAETEKQHQILATLRAKRGI